MRHPRRSTTLFDVLVSLRRRLARGSVGGVLSLLRRRLVGASVGGVLAATVLPAGLLALVEPAPKDPGPLGSGKLSLPLKRAAPPTSFEELLGRESIEGHLTAADIRRARRATRVERKRMLRDHPHFGVYKAAKRRFGVSWYLVAALHHARKGMSHRALMDVARRLRDARAGSGLDRRAWRAVVATHRGPGSAAAAATLALERARAWKQMGLIPLPSGDKLASPVDGVVPGCGYFHCPRPGHLHNGLDLSAPAGTPIHAVQAGRVAILEGTGQSGGYGLFVCLQHSPALASCYAHLSSFAPGLALGDEVTRGQVIGLVGCTGHCFGAHLHFEIRRGPASCSHCAVDPVPYLSGKVPDVPAPTMPKLPAPASPALRAHAPAGAPLAAVPGRPVPVTGPAPSGEQRATVDPAPSSPLNTPTPPSKAPGRRPIGYSAPTPAAVGGAAPTPAPAPRQPAPEPAPAPSAPEPAPAGREPEPAPAPPPSPPPADPAPAPEGGAQGPPADDD
jgi:hypothetical protein